jgi:hypothetical protein
LDRFGGSNRQRPQDFTGLFCQAQSHNANDLDQATAANPEEHPINAAPLRPQRQLVNEVHVELS